MQGGGKGGGGGGSIVGPSVGWWSLRLGCTWWLRLGLDLVVAVMVVTIFMVHGLRALSGQCNGWNLWG